MSGERAAITSRLLELASHYSGRVAESASLLTADLGLQRWDYIEFIERVEKEFGADLTVVSPREVKAVAQECSIDQLATIILERAK